MSLVRLLVDDEGDGVTEVYDLDAIKITPGGLTFIVYQYDLATGTRTEKEFKVPQVNIRVENGRQANPKGPSKAR